MRTGVYQIRNLVNDKRYVGSTAMDFTRRWTKHKNSLNVGSHHSIVLQRAWDKYGADSFIFEVLLYCDSDDCLTYEQFALDCFKPEYNICNTAGSQLGRKHSLETRKLMSRDRRGAKNSNSKLAESDIGKIKDLLLQGMSQRKIAKQFKISQVTIHKINAGKLWVTA